MSPKPKSVGIIVARFQVPELTAGHRYLVEQTKKNHDEVCIVLGSTDAELIAHSPLSANVRRMMIQNAFAGVLVAELKDTPSDIAWSTNLDELISDIYPDREAVLYGSRGSFIPHYHGKFPTQEVKHIFLESGTAARYAAGQVIRDSADFRAGIIYAAINRRPLTHPTVDLAILNRAIRKVLLGRKNSDGGKWRFIGGFFDPTKDRTKKSAANREGHEEAGKDLSLDNFQLIDSVPIDDPRYRGTGDIIMTDFFMADYLFGPVEAGDDLDEVAWFDYDDVGANLIEMHTPLGGLFNQYVRDVK